MCGHTTAESSGILSAVLPGNVLIGASIADNLCVQLRSSPSLVQPHLKVMMTAFGIPWPNPVVHHSRICFEPYKIAPVSLKTYALPQLSSSRTRWRHLEVSIAASVCYSLIHWDELWHHTRERLELGKQRLVSYLLLQKLSPLPSMVVSPLHQCS